MVYKIGKILMLISITILIGCGGEGLSPKKYYAEITDPDNGYLIIKEFPEIRFKVQYKPLDFVVLQEYKRNVPNMEEMISLRNEFKGMHYFTLSIEPIGHQADLLKLGNTDRQEYEEKLNYYAFQANQDLTLYTDNDTLPCHLYHFERDYGIKPGINMVFAFENITNEFEDIRLVFHDRVFGNGILQYIFKEQIMRNQPELNV